MTPQEFLDKFGTLAESAQGVPKLRELILELAVRGKLVEQDESDEPASELLMRIEQDSVNNGRQGPCRKKTPSLPHGPPFALPASWEWSPFNRVATIASNLVKPGDHLDFPHIAPNNIEKFNGQLLKYQTVREDGVKSNKHRFFAGQILYSKIRPNLSKATIVDFDGLCSADMYPLDAHIDARYLLTFILSFPFLRMAVKTDTRVAMPKINQTELNRVLVAVPPLAEQHRIVSKVDELMGLCDRLEAVQGERRGVRVRLNRSSLDRLTSSSTARGGAVSAAWQRVCDHFEVLYDTPETLPDLRQTILQLAVQGKLVPQDPNDEPAEGLLEKKHALPNGYKRKRKILKKVPIVAPDELFAPVPASWVYAEIQDLYDRKIIIDYADGNHGSLYPRKTEFGTTGVTFVSAKDLVGGRVIWDGVAKLDEERAAQLSKGWAEGGDVLLTHNATVGRVARVEPDVERFLLGTSVTFYRLNPSGMNSDYFYLVLASPQWQGQLESIMRQTTRNQVSIQKQAYFRIPVPPLSEQKRIVSKVTVLLSQVTRLESTLTRREATRTQLLTAAIHGILNGQEK